MQKVLLSSVLVLFMTDAFAQKFTWNQQEFEAINTKAEIKDS
ncbi:hypothetical protein [Flavobacterium maritimum]|jgi:hypothetical protein